MVRFGLPVLFISSSFLFFCTSVPVVSGRKETKVGEKEGTDARGGKATKTSSEKERRTEAQTTCNSELGYCFPLRAVSDIRFNKLPPVANDDEWYVPCDDYVNGCHKGVYPMLPTHYPFGDMADRRSIIQKHTKADSVVMPGDFELKNQVDNPLYWLAKGEFTKKQPIYPGEDLYWDELRHVVQVQLKRRNGEDPSNINRWPDQWADKDLEGIASAIRGEYPGFHQQTLIESMFRKGIELYDNMKPFRSHVDFVGKQVRIADINTWAFHAVAAVNFMLKWHVGMPRPEEMAWLIASRQLTTADDGVPQDIVADIKSMNLQNAHDFTAYDTGSPTHPSWPAMHSAGSTVSYWLPAIAKITGEDYCEALRVDYAVSYGRTVAGVHYQQDNLAGLNIGQRLVREQLPEFLESKYGYNAKIVKANLDALSFAWETFDPISCQIRGVSASVFLTNALASVPEMMVAEVI